MTVPSAAGFEAGQDDIEIFGLDIQNPAFFVSGGIILPIVFFGAVRTGLPSATAGLQGAA